MMMPMLLLTIMMIQDSVNCTLNCDAPFSVVIFFHLLHFFVSAFSTFVASFLFVVTFMFVVYFLLVTLFLVVVSFLSSVSLFFVTYIRS